MKIIFLKIIKLIITLWHILLIPLYFLLFIMAFLILTVLFTLLVPVEAVASPEAEVAAGGGGRNGWQIKPSKEARYFFNI